MSWNFLGFFLEDSKITNERILGYNVQKLKLLKNNHPCLLLLTDEFHVDMMSNKNIKNIETLNLVEYYYS